MDDIDYSGWWQVTGGERIVLITRINQRGFDTLVQAETLDGGRLINRRYMRITTLTTYYHRIEDLMSDISSDLANAGVDPADIEQATDNVGQIADGSQDAGPVPGSEPDSEPEPETPVEVSPKAAIMQAAAALAATAYAAGQADGLEDGSSWEQQAIPAFELALDGVLTDGPLQPGWYDTDYSNTMLLRDTNSQWWMVTDMAQMMATDWTYIQTVLAGGSVRLVKALS